MPAPGGLPAGAMLAPRAVAPGPGLRLSGRYRLETLISDPGRAAAWRAIDELLARPVTVRILPPGLPLAGPALAAVRAAARLTDPRLARIFDADDCGDYPYIICEQPPGEHLEDLLAAGLPDPALAAAIVAEAADAIAVAHLAGAAHFFLSPRSVLWDSTGVKITGLGIEAALHGAATAGQDGPSMAAADTRALGGILYALLTGYWPAQQPTGLAPAPRSRGRLLSPRQVRAGLPSALDEITRRVLPSLPHQGPPVAAPAELAAALRSARRVAIRLAWPPASAPPVMAPALPGPAVARLRSRYLNARLDSGFRPMLAGSR